MDVAITSLIGSLVSTGSGLDISGYFFVRLYNQLVDRKWKIDDFGNNECVGVVLGSTSAIWDPFISWIGSIINRNEELPDHPLNSYVLSLINDGLKDYSGRYRIYYDWDEENLCHMQTAGHLAGIAYYDRTCGWSFHPKFGLWFSFRCVIVFDIISPSIELKQMSDDILEPVSQEITFSLMKYANDNPYWWKDEKSSRDYRNIVVNGNDVEYSQDQLIYHSCLQDIESRHIFLRNLCQKSSI